MGKATGFALSALRTKDVRRFLERQGYRVEPGQHKHLKLKHDRLGTVLLPLRPGDQLSFVAVKQIAVALGITPEELSTAVRSG
ncbi:MAG TPA: type II toxin-antitoxin system HicA family toxin [Dehalococcoidia bacterium]|nr:type II toxin-antitoxin system HicA family toxin [Chloroflexota bacterium]HZU76008.1 type II toxin-antitoxin system HicA family toxin [Dehalococcoidia bacterium]